MSALPCGRPAGSVDVDQVGLEEQLAAGLAVAGAGRAGCRRRCPSASRARHAGGERVEEAAHLARVARDFGHALLVVVELLERDHRQVDVVLLEAEQGRRVVHQHVGVEHEQRRRAVAARLRGARSAARRTAAARGAARRRARRFAATGGAAGSVRLRRQVRAAAGGAGLGARLRRGCARLPGCGAACGLEVVGGSRRAARLAGGLGRGMRRLEWRGEQSAQRMRSARRHVTTRADAGRRGRRAGAVRLSRLSSAP